MEPCARPTNALRTYRAFPLDDTRRDGTPWHRGQVGSYKGVNNELQASFG